MVGPPCTVAQVVHCSTMPGPGSGPKLKSSFISAHCSPSRAALCPESKAFRDFHDTGWLPPSRKGETEGGKRKEGGEGEPCLLLRMSVHTHFYRCSPGQIPRRRNGRTCVHQGGLSDAAVTRNLRGLAQLRCISAHAEGLLRGRARPSRPGTQADGGSRGRGCAIRRMQLPRPPARGNGAVLSTWDWPGPVTCLR